MKKFILFQLKTGKSVRILLNKKTYIHPVSGKRLKTSALLNQHKQFVNDRNYRNKLIRSGKYDVFDIKRRLGKQKFGTQYLAEVGLIRSSKGRLETRFASRVQEESILNLHNELEIRREIDATKSMVGDTPYLIDGGEVRNERSILQDLQTLIQPDNIKFIKRGAIRAFRRVGRK